MDFFKRLLIDRWGGRRDDFDWRVYQAPTDLSGLESILVLNLNGKLGDALMISLMVDALARARSDLPISVGTTQDYAEYWRRNPLVSDVAVLPNSRKVGRRMGRRIREAKRAARPWQGRFSAVVSFEPYAVLDHFALFRTLGAKVNIGFNKHPYRLFTYSLEERRHGVVAESVATRTARVMEVFGRNVDLKDLEFSVPVLAEDECAARSIVERGRVGSPRLLLNVYGGGPEKWLTPESAARAVREIRQGGHRGPIFLSLPSEGGPYLDALRTESLDGDVVPVEPLADYFKLFALVEMMDLVVSPDTAVGHIAAAFKKPQVVLFAEGGTIPIAWKPFSDRCVSIVSTTGRNVNDLDWDAFREALAESSRMAHGWRSVV